MATDDLNFADLDDLEAALKAAGVKSVSRDPSAVRAPGVWIRFDGIEPGTLATLRVKTTLFPVVASSTTRSRSENALAALYNTVKPVIDTYGGAAGPIKPIGLILPGSQTPLPAFQIPLDLLTTN